MNMLALSETKLKGKDDMMFGRVIVRVSVVERGHGRGRVALLE